MKEYMKENKADKIINKNEHTEVQEDDNSLKQAIHKRENIGGRRPALMQGIYQANSRGFGFVSVDDLEQDLFIPEGEAGTALDGDVVEVQLKPTFDGNVIPDGKDGRRQEAGVVRIITRNTTTVVGTFYGKKGSGSVIPDNRKIPADIRIPSGRTMNAVNGHKVVARITDYGEGRTPSLEGEIIEILGHMDDPGVDILSIMRAYHLPQEFPEEVMEEVRADIPQEIDLTGIRLVPEGKAESGRQGNRKEAIEDWRNVPIVTIDGPDTKDIDDAVSIRRIPAADRKPALWELGVHIADVSRYVREGTPLDHEALSRGTSNYLVDRVIPMLPHELSNGICSLNPGEDRFALSCIMEIDSKGNIVNSRVVETVIRSRAKLTYPGVMRLFEDGDETELKNQLEAQAEGTAYETIVSQYGECQDSDTAGASRRRYSRGVAAKAHELAAMLRLGRRLSHVISKKRSADGAIDFEFPECKIQLDELGRVTDIVPYVRNEATMMIENFMVAANETVAETFYWLGVPFVYRTHGVPTEEKMQQLKEFIRGFGDSFKWNHGDIHPKELQTMLADLAGRPEAPAIAAMTLRSMQRAVYTTECGGHFGLALRYYCHFTSPIRRYPDLQIHRIIREYLYGRLNNKRRAHYEAILPSVCRQSSDMERRADEAERETDKQKMCEYMKGHIGEMFEGTIDGVTGWGFYVQLPNTVEGLVPVRSLRDDFYDYDDNSMQLIGRRTGKRYMLGQRVNVSVASVDTTARTIDFELLTNKKAEKLSERQNAGSRRERHGMPGRLDRNGNPLRKHHSGHGGHHR